MWRRNRRSGVAWRQQSVIVNHAEISSLCWPINWRRRRKWWRGGGIVKRNSYCETVSISENISEKQRCQLAASVILLEIDRL